MVSINLTELSSLYIIYKPFKWINRPEALKYCHGNYSLTGIRRFNELFVATLKFLYLSFHCRPFCLKLQFLSALSILFKVTIAFTALHFVKDTSAFIVARFVQIKVQLILVYFL